MKVVVRVVILCWWERVQLYPQNCKQEISSSNKRSPYFLAVLNTPAGSATIQSATKVRGPSSWMR